MRWPAPMRDQEGFTLVEILISMLILGILIASIGGALIVSLKTSDATKQRFAESHDVQIASAYLANDVQSASAVDVPSSTANCSGAFTRLITFTYGTAGHPTAVYECGMATNGETQIRRTFNNGTPVVLVHFAGSARPNVTVTPDNSTPPIPVSVEMTFTKASDCTLDCTYSLFGSRRSFGPSVAPGVGSPPLAPVTLLSTGTNSPLWVQGGADCLDPATTTDCDAEPTTIASALSDRATGGWTTVPASPPTLSDKLNDRSDSTWITTSGNGMAQVNLTGVPPGGSPYVEFRAASPNTGQPARFEIHVYDATTMQELVSSPTLSANSNVPKNVDWSLGVDAVKIPDAAYQHLALGFKVTNNRLLNLYGAAFDTNPVGLLTIKGSLYVNSRNPEAVRLTGKTKSPKLSVSPGKFKILGDSTLGFGGCPSCSAQTVSCPACPGGWQFESYSPELLDPLRSLPAPDPSTLPSVSCPGSSCPPGVYNDPLQRTSNTTLSPGIYYLKQGMSITGNASLICPAPCSGGVMIYNADGGAITLAGGSTIDLTPPSSGLYKDIVIFQSRTNGSPVKVTGSAGKATPINFRGIIYVPNSTQVTLATGSATLNALAIVAQNIKVSSPVTIG